MDKSTGITTLIVGATSTFGQSIAQKLADTHHNLILTATRGSIDKLNQFKDNFIARAGQSALLLEIDVTDPLDVARTISSLPCSVDNVVYSVGSPVQFKVASQEDWEVYERHWNTQVKGCWQVVTQLVRLNHRLSRVVAIGSSTVFNTPSPRLSSYIVAKYGLLGLMRCLAVELAAGGTTVNMVSPGASGSGLSQEFPNLLLELTKKNTLLNKLVTPEDVASIVCFLLSDEAGYLTGLNIPADGGLHMG